MHETFEILVMSPPLAADVSLAVAAERAGLVGIVNAELPLPEGRLGPLVEAAIAGRASRAEGLLGLAIGDLGAALDLAGRHAGRGLDLVVLPAEAALAQPEAVLALRAAGLRVVLEAIRWDDRLTAAAAEGLIVKGHEAGGRVGEATAFILLQEALAAGAGPVFVRGGIGMVSAGAVRAGGAAGVVLDDQVLLVRESGLADALRPRLARLSGAETVLVEGADGVRWRGLERPGSRTAAGLRSALARLEAVEAQDGVAAAALGWDLDSGLIAPLGQAAAFATDLAQRHGSLGRLAVAMREESGRLVRLAAAHPTLGEGQGVAIPHGTRWPIVQGPMTRVSDTAAFASSVAGSGALPMLALALMRPEQADRLLGQVARDLAGKPWGVGLLGFAPSALVKAQVEIALRHGPAFALIAGGRPEQARALEADGIPSYLHVPSPTLLRMFLDQGARRFVFEGRECGGHVGPMSSLVLWDAMVRTLLEAVTDPAVAAETSILFAGGIHDARSAAMVQAFAAPLAERGIRVGVLMGSAYLFTAEAVEAGAIAPEFQRILLDCRETVTLETGAGHASRAALSPFAEEFAARRRALEAEGIGGEAMREALEDLTLGRLRIASKGTERQGDAIAPVDEARQRAEGMYMIGQVAGLRHGLTTMEALHREVSEGSAALLAGLAAAPEVIPARPRGPAPADVAIVGIAAVLPGADDAATFWENILDGRDAVTEIPRDRWDWRLYFDADPSAPDRIYSKWGGFLTDMPFDPMRYGIPPRSIPALDPLQLMTLEVASRCLADAGYDGEGAPRGPRLRTSVILGASGGAGDVGAQYAVRSEMPRFTGRLDPDAAARLPEWTEDSFAGILLNVAAGRTANRLDFGGVNYTVDAACASSLAAVYQAVIELETGRSDMVLAGGVDTVQGPFGYLCFSKTRALSPRGRCSSFEADADGIVISEGLAMVALKRLADAERDGDRVYAVIKGVGGSSDGKARSMTAPHPDGQVRALTRAYEMAGYSPATVGLFEAHGTGTVVGDTAEIATVTRLLIDAGAEPRAAAIGSVKTRIGHTKAAAGIAGLIKAALSVHHGVLPPHGRRGAPNAALADAATPLHLVDRPRPWIAQGPRRAGVSAFGFGGTNFHVTLEEHAGRRAIPALAPAPRRDWPAELLVWRGTDRAALARDVGTMAARLGQGWAPDLADLALSLAQVARGPRAATLVVRRGADLALAVAALARHLADPSAPLPKGAAFTDAPLLAEGGLALVFPGQGSQYPEMFAEVAALLPAVAEALAVTDLALGEPLSRMILPVGAYDEAAQADAARALTATDMAQPALGAVEGGLWALLSGMGLRPAMAAGHSYGELVALHAAGVLSAADLARVSRARGRLMMAAGGDDLGGMAAVKAPREQVEALIAGIEDITLANHNAPEQSILSGTRSGLAEAATRAAALGLDLRPLAVGAAFHSEVIAGAADAFGEVLADIPFAPARFPVYSNTTAAPHGTDIAAALARQLAAPVEFVREIERMHEDGARVFLTLGPRTSHAGMIRQILGDRPHRAIAVDDGEGGLGGLLGAIGALMAEGAELDLASLFAGRSRAVVALTGAIPAPAAPRAGLWLLNGGGARPAGTPPRPVLTLEEAQARDAARLVASSAPTAKTPAVAALLVAALPTPSDPAPPRPDLTATPRVAPPAAPTLHRPTRPAAPARRASPTPQRTRMDGTYDLLPEDPYASAPAAPSPLAEFQATMARFLETQERVMMAFLGVSQAAPAAAPRAVPALRPPMATRALPVAAPIAAPPAAPRPAPMPTPAMAAPSMPAPVAPPPQAPAPAAAIQPAPAPVAPVAAPAPASAPALDRAGLAALLLGIVEDRTGYPADMLGMDQGIESDLGIDSIKRLEIVGALIKALPAPQSAAAAPLGETLNEQKTLGAIVDRLHRHLTEGGAAREAAHPFDRAGADHAGQPARPPRFILRTEPAPLAVPRAASRALPPGRYLVTGGGGAAAARIAGPLATRIERAGGQPVTVDDGSPLAGLVHLGAMGADLIDLADPSGWTSALDAGDRAAFLVLRSHPELATGRVILVSAMGGRFGREGGPLRLVGGAPGLAKSLREEWPEARTRAVDLDPSAPSKALADAIMAELAAPEGRIEVGYPGGVRHVVRSVEAPVPAMARDLPQGALVLATGGARGITAEVLRPFAAAGARLVLVGRAALPIPEEPATRGLDAVSLRSHLLAAARAGGTAATPAQIERAVAARLRDREILANLADLSSRAASVDYLAADMADPASVRALVAQVRSMGPIHGVIHGAGVIEDRRLLDKAPDSWDRVVAPKVLGTLALAAALDDAPPAFMALFASVAGRYGNSGQADYATANELMARLASSLSARWTGSRVVAVDWGPWAGTRHGAGMVSDAVRRKFEAQDVVLVDPDGGAAAFFDEIVAGPLDVSEVVLGAGPWERHERERGGEADAAAPFATELGRPLLGDGPQKPGPRGGTRIARRLSLGRDPWLGEHRIGGTPVLPLAVAAEMAAEAAAAVWPEWRVEGLSDLRLLSGLRLEGDRDLAVDLVATGAEHGDPTGFAARVELRGQGEGARAHYRASARMVPAGAAMVPDPDALALAEEVLALHPRAAATTARDAYRDLLFHGPSFQLIKVIEGADPRGIAARVSPSRPTDFGGGPWAFDPGLLDAAAQLAWVWSALERGAPALPNAIGRLVRLGEGRPARMALRLRPGSAAPQVLADIAVADAEGRPVLLIEALESTSDAGLARFSGWSGEILADVPDLAEARAAE